MRTFLVKMSFNHCYALSLALKQRLGATRKLSALRSGDEFEARQVSYGVCVLPLRKFND